MKKLFASLILLLLPVSAHAITYQSVRASTNNVDTPSLQTGTMNLSSGTITNLNTTTLKGGTGAFTGAVSAASFSPASAIPSGSTQYIQNTSALQSGATFFVSSGTVSGPLAVTGTLSGTGASNLTGAVMLGGPGNSVRVSSNTIMPGATFYASGLITTTQVLGKVKQIVSFTTTSSSATSVTSFVNTNLKTSITPTSASNKVLILAFGNLRVDGVADGFVSIGRNSANLLASTGQAYGRGQTGTTSGANSFNTPFSVGYLDSPATTSSTEYEVQMRTSSGSVQVTVGDASVTQFMLLVELEP